MFHDRWWICLAALCVFSGDVSAQGPGKRPMRREVDLKEGSVAPDFTVKDLTGKTTVKLADLKGKPVVLIFGSCT